MGKEDYIKLIRRAMRELILVKPEDRDSVKAAKDTFVSIIKDLHIIIDFSVYEQPQRRAAINEFMQCMRMLNKLGELDGGEDAKKTLSRGLMLLLDAIE